METEDYVRNDVLLFYEKMDFVGLVIGRIHSRNRNSDGFATTAATSSCNRDLSPPPRMNLEIKSAATRVACPKGTPSRRKSLVFISINNRQPKINRPI